MNNASSSRCASPLVTLVAHRPRLSARRSPALAQVAVPDARPTAAWSPTSSGKVVGSELIGQAFANPAYFQPRPSAAGDKGYDATASGGSNLGADLEEAARPRRRRRRAAARRRTPTRPGPIPAELVTASASGLDPHLSPEAALLAGAARRQGARRRARARARSVVEAHVEGRDLGFLGEPRVNVLRAQPRARPAVRQAGEDQRRRSAGTKMSVLEIRTEPRTDPDGRRMRELLQAIAEVERYAALHALTIHALAGIGVLLWVGVAFPALLPRHPAPLRARRLRRRRRRHRGGAHPRAPLAARAAPLHARERRARPRLGRWTTPSVW